MGEEKTESKYVVQKPLSLFSMKTDIIVAFVKKPEMPRGCFTRVTAGFLSVLFVMINKDMVVIVSFTLQFSKLFKGMEMKDLS